MIDLDFLSVTFSTFTLTALAEIGDKSQLVCMTLACRYTHWPVLLGASAAFLVLNTLAVLFGASISAWIPEQILAIVVSVLFAVFGLQMFRNNDEDDEVIQDVTGTNIFLTSFMLIAASEFGDKTQLTVAALSTSYSPIPVWFGASIGLIMISALGVIAGRTILQKISISLLHKLSGGLFLVFAGIAAYRAVS